MDRLPDELLLIIFHYLDTENLFKLLDVNKRFRAIASDWTLWPREYFSTFVTRYINHVKTLPELSKLRKLLLIGTRIKYLRVFNCYEWMTNLTTLRELDIQLEIDSNVKSSRVILCNTLMKIISNNKHLEKLTIEMMHTKSFICGLELSIILNRFWEVETNLTSLTLKSPWRSEYPVKIDLTELEGITHIKSLTELNIEEYLKIDFKTVNCLTQLENLSDVYIDARSIVINGKVSEYYDVVKLMKVFKIDSRTNFECDVELPKLIDFTFHGHGDLDNGDYLAGWLSNCKNLTKLDMSFFDNYEDDNLFSDIFNMHEVFTEGSLTELNIKLENQECGYFSVELNIETLKKLKIEDFDINCSLSGLVNLTELSLLSCEHRQESIDSIGKLYKLQKLTMTSRHSTGIPDINYDRFSGLTDLTDLDIDHVKDTDDFYRNLPKSIVNYCYSPENSDYFEDTEYDINCNGIRFMTGLENLILSVREIDRQKISSLASIGLKTFELYVVGDEKMDDSMIALFKSLSPDTKLIIY